jgi:putrescine transport system ATP-binding protein
MPRVEAVGLTKTFGRTLAVDDVSFTVAGGELFSLLGPSGCGKTTLLRMLAGLEVPDVGQLLIDGRDITAVPAFQRPVNMMFQRYALFPHMNVFDNVAYGLRRAGLRRAELRSRVVELLTLVRLDGLANRRPDQLSGGQQQRVALARALARRPQLLLLDEPLAALDRRLRESTALELKRLQRETDTTFIMVTHDQDEAMTLSTRVGVMFDGRIRQIAPPRVVYEHPADRRVAEFIGDANFIEASVVRVAEREAVLDAGGKRFVVSADDVPLPPGTPVTIGIRPERMSVLTDPPARNGLRASIEAVLYHGDVSVYHARAEGGASFMVRLPNDGTRPRMAAEDHVWLGFEPGDAFVLPA